VFRRRPNKKGNHRAHQDILESIAELAFYRDTVFQKVG
jgi:oligoribonuclease (3'-5' exoribonuclease)